MKNNYYILSEHHDRISKKGGGRDTRSNIASCQGAERNLPTHSYEESMQRRRVLDQSVLAFSFAILLQEIESLRGLT
jgi:hypothetical protein